MEQERQVRSFLARFFELPQDVVMDLPRLTMIGDLQLVVENHRGILAFSADQVLVKTRKGTLKVTGSSLIVGAVDRETIILTGKLQAVTFGDVDG